MTKKRASSHKPQIPPNDQIAVGAARRSPRFFMSHPRSMMRVRILEHHASYIELGYSGPPPSAKIAAAVVAVLAPESFVRPRQLCSSCRKPARNDSRCLICRQKLSLWKAIEIARDRRTNLMALLSQHDLPARYLALILIWFEDAADFRARAAVFQRNRTHGRRRDAANRQAIATCLAALSTNSRLRAAFTQRGLPDGRLTWAMREIVRGYDEKPDLLRYLYFVGARGHPKTDAGRELHALLMNFVGMWHTIKGELPAVQEAPGKRLGAREEQDDEGGNPLSKPFIAMSRDLLEALGRDDLVPSLKYAARKVVEELKMGGWHLLDSESA